MSEHIALEVVDGVAIVTLNKPEKKNAIDTDMVRVFAEVLDVVDGDDAVGAVVVTGAGSAFCAGADVSGGKIAQPPQSADAIPRDSSALVSLRLFRMRKPVVAAVNGAAVGFGATVILPMDFRVVSAKARIGYPFVLRGVTPDAASSWFLPRVVGLPTALDWMMTGRLFDAEEALASGLATEVVSAEDVLTRAVERARHLMATASPLSIALTRQLLWGMLGAPHPMDAHRVESAALQHTKASADSVEGIAAFLEKRAPVWPDRLSDRMPDWYPWASEPPYTSVMAAKPSESGQ